MARVSIRIVGPWSAWDSRARRAQLVREDGSTAEVLLHPGGAGALPALEQARAEGRVVGAARHPAALHLKQVTQVGGASTWVFDGFAGASLARVSRELAPRGEALPLRLVAEVGVAVVDALGELGAPAQAAEGRQVVHPGPTPGMVLLSRDGQLKVAGFRAPPAGTRLEPPPGYGAPEGGQAPPAQVYAVGALLVELLGGEPPPAAGADADGHAAGVRRALIRVVSRPGPRAPEALVDLLRECLAFAPQARPSLPRLSVRLSRVVRDLPSPDLLTWARDALPRLWPALVGADAAGMDAPGPAGAAGAPRSAFGAVEVDPGLAAPTEAAGRGRALAPDDATASAGRGARSRPPEALLEHDTEEVERTRVRQEPAGRPLAEGSLRSRDPAQAGRAAAGAQRPRARTGPAREEAIEQAGAAAEWSGVEATVVVPRQVVEAAGASAAGASAAGASAAGASAAGASAGAGPGLAVGRIAPRLDEDDELLAPRSRRPGAGVWLAGAVVLGIVAVGALWGLRTRSTAGDAEALGTAQAPAVAVPAALDEALGDAGELPPAAPEAAVAPEAAAALEAVAVAAPAPAPGAEAGPAAPRAPTRASSQESSARGDGAARSPAARTSPASPAVPSAPAAAPAVVPTPAPTATATASPPAAPTAAPAAAPTAASARAAAPAPASPAPPFSLRFTSAYEGVQRLEVQCHGGRVASGAVVTIPDAVPGPCKVQGTTVDGGRLVALVSVSGDGSWRCFEGGERACR